MIFPRELGLCLCSCTSSEVFFLSALLSLLLTESRDSLKFFQSNASPSKETVMNAIPGHHQVLDILTDKRAGSAPNCDRFHRSMCVQNRL